MSDFAAYEFEKTPDGELVHRKWELAVIKRRRDGVTMRVEWTGKGRTPWKWEARRWGENRPLRQGNAKTLEAATRAAEGRK